MLSLISRAVGVLILYAVWHIDIGYSKCVQSWVKRSLWAIYTETVHTVIQEVRQMIKNGHLKKAVRATDKDKYTGNVLEVN